MTRKKIHLTSTEVLPDEQLLKHAVSVEDVDLAGLVKRHRVLTQTVFDLMFIREIIDQGSYEAAHQFMDDFGQSGGVAKSVNLESENHSPGHSISNAMGERRMIFSKAYRAMVDGSNEDDVSFFLEIIRHSYNSPSKFDSLKKIGARCRGPLGALSRHYGTDGRTDPRDIIRRQVGARRKRRGRAR